MDIDFNEVFDIETAETVEDAPDAAQEAAEEQEAQEQSQDTGDENTPENEPEKPKEQSTEERARQAEGRRRREWEERGAKAERERASALLARLAIKNPATGEAFNTLDELEAYDKGLRDTRLKEGRANDGDIREVVREEMAKAREPEQSAETQPSEDPRITAELEQIKAMDPDTKGDINVILSSPQGAKFREYVNKGLSFLDAYTLAARDKLDAAKAEKADEAARVKAASKDHLSATGSRGQGALSVPADIMAQYRVFMPDASPEEIQKHYNADRKRYGPK